MYEDSIRVMLCLVPVLILTLFLHYRNNLVCSYRTRILWSEPLEKYYKLPSYNYMFCQIFRFNWDSYLKD